MQEHTTRTPHGRPLTRAPIADRGIEDAAMDASQLAVESCPSPLVLFRHQKNPSIIVAITSAKVHFLAQ